MLAKFVNWVRSWFRRNFLGTCPKCGSDSWYHNKNWGRMDCRNCLYHELLGPEELAKAAGYSKLYEYGGKVFGGIAQAQLAHTLKRVPSAKRMEAYAELDADDLPLGNFWEGFHKWLIQQIREGE